MIFNLLFSFKTLLFLTCSYFLAFVLSFICRDTNFSRSSVKKVFLFVGSNHHISLAFLRLRSDPALFGIPIYLMHKNTIYELNGSELVSISPVINPTWFSFFFDSSYIRLYFALNNKSYSFSSFRLSTFFEFVSSILIVVPHVTPWLFPSFLDLLISTLLRIRRQAFFIDDGTSGILHSSLPHRYFGCPQVDYIYSIDYSWINSSFKTSSCSVSQYLETLYFLRSAFRVTTIFPSLPTSSALVISSKFLDLKAVSQHADSYSYLLAKRLSYIPHPRAWKNDFAALNKFLPRISILREDYVELLIRECSSNIDLIYVGCSSVAFVLAQMKLSGLLHARLVVAVSMPQSNRYSSSRELCEFVQQCHSSSAFEEISFL